MTKSAYFVLAAALAAGPAAMNLTAQQRPARPAATTKLATINDKPFTAGDLTSLLRNAPDDFLALLKQDPKLALTNFTLLRQLSDQARAAGLDKVFPYKQRIEWVTSTELTTAQLNALVNSIDVPEAEIRDQYNKNIQKYRLMTFTVIRILNATHGGSAQAKAVAEDVVRQARNGADFADLGAKYSSEPDSALPGSANTIDPTFEFPPAAKDRIWATLPGTVTDPVEMKESWVIVKVLTLKAKPYADVRPEIRGELQQQRSGSEIEKIQKGITVKVLMPQFFAANAPNPEPGAPLPESIDKAAIVAEISGRRISSQELYESFQGMAPTARQSAAKNPTEFLRQYETMQLMTADARKAGLDKKPPASDRIFWTTDQVLYQAQIDEKTKSTISSLQEQQDFYKKNEDKFRVAQTKLIYVAYSISPPPGSNARNEVQALERAMQARKRAEAGADFAALVKEFSEDPNTRSKDGDMGLRYADQNLPVTVRDAVFSAKPGQLAGPVRLANGFYLFRVKENKVLPFDEVRNDIYNALSDEKIKAWFDSNRDKIHVTIDDPKALSAELTYH